MSHPARRPAWAARLRAATCAVVVTTAGLGPAAVADQTTSGYAVHPPVAGLRVVLDDVEPTVPRIGEPVVLRGRVVNESGTQRRIGHVTAEASWTPITSRVGVADWVSGPVGTGTEWFLGVDAVGPVVAAGSQLPFAVTVPEEALVGLDGDRTVLGLEIHAHEEEDGPPGLVVEAPATLRTVLTVDRGTPAPVPLETSWVVPLTLPPDPDLGTPDDDRWVAAWTAAVGEDSPVHTWLDDLDVPGVTWVVDPAVLAPGRPEELVATAGPDEEPADGPTGEPTDGPTDGPGDGPTGEDPSATTGGTDGQGGQPGGDPAGDDAPATVAPPDEPGSGATPTPGATPTGPAAVPPPDGSSATDGPEEAPTTAEPGDDEPPVTLTPEEQVDSTVEALRERLAGLDDEQLWWLPAHDPDLAAVLAGTRDEALLTRLVGRRTQTDEETRALLDRGRSSVAWPVPVGADPADLARVSAAWDAAGAGLPTVVLPAEAVAGPSEAPVSRGAVPLAQPAGASALAADSRASALLAGAEADAARDGLGASVQRLLADSLTAWGQDPSSARSVVVAAPRGTALPGPLLAELSDGITTAPWLTSVTAESLLLDAATAAPATPTGAGPEPEVIGSDPAYLAAGESPLDAEGLRTLTRLSGQLTGLRQVLVDPTAVSTWQEALAGAWSTRWRGEPDGWAASWSPLAEAGDDARTALHVNPGTVNFLAAEGLMRVTIVNSLPVAVDNVRVRLVSSSNVLQIVDQPEPIAVGADSRATVTFSARAITRGQTTVTAELTAPNGTALGDDAAVDVRVQPTGVWIYWVLGAIAGVVLVLGLWRAVRSTTPRAVLAGTRRPPGDRPATTTSEPA